MPWIRIFILISISTLIHGEGIDSILRNSVNDQHDLDYSVHDHVVKVDMDMLFDESDWEFIQSYGYGYGIKKRDIERMKRKGIAVERRWPNATIYYEYKDKFSHFDRQVIQNAFDDYHKYTCIKFVPTEEGINRKIFFQNGTGCTSFIGTKEEKPQAVTLGPKCRYKSVVLHELGHAAGLFHEHTRPDRDEYVKIHLENVLKGQESNFNKFNELVIPDLGVEYDYKSLMHYGSHDMSKNGERTITPINGDTSIKLGNNKGFTYADLKTLNLMYNCGGHCKEVKCEGYLDKDCNCMCDGRSEYLPVRVCDGRSVVKPTGGKKGGKGGTSGKKGKRCRDKVSDCRKHYMYCTDKAWESYMTKNCQGTCRNICEKS